MARWLLERLERAGDKPAIVWRDREYTYAWLREQVERWRRELDERGVRPGTVVALESDYSPLATALFLALVDLRAIAVPLASNLQDRERRYAIAQVQQVLRLEGEECSFQERGAEPDHPLLRGLVEAGNPGLVIFTSGSTGEPKAVLHDFSRILDAFKAPRRSLRTITFLLFDHIGGVNTLLGILANDGVMVCVEDRRPDAVCAAVERHRVELLPPTPTFLNLLLLSEAYKRHDLSSLTQITYGTEPMPETTLSRLREVLPGVRLFQAYGLSELGIVRSESRGSDSPWIKLGGAGFEAKVVDGALWIRAETAMLGYLNAPSPFDEEGWFNTEDEVLVDGEYVRILGRRSEIINVGGEKVFPAEVEDVLLELPSVRDVIVRGEPNPLTGQIVVAQVELFEPEPMPDFRRRMREHCRTRLDPWKIPAKVEPLDPAAHSERFKKIRTAP